MLPSLRTADPLLVLEDESGSINLKDPTVGDNAKIRKVGVCRMPFVAGISSACLPCQGKCEKDSRFSPKIDPLNAYYVMYQTICVLDGFTCGARCIGDGLGHSGKMRTSVLLCRQLFPLSGLNYALYYLVRSPNFSNRNKTASSSQQNNKGDDMPGLDGILGDRRNCWKFVKRGPVSNDGSQTIYSSQPQPQPPSNFTREPWGIEVGPQSPHVYTTKRGTRLVITEGCCSSSSMLLSLPRLAPESVTDLEEFILKFFQGLPHATIICISMFGDEFAGLLRELFPYNPPSPTIAWIMLSRLNSDSILLSCYWLLIPS